MRRQPREPRPPEWAIHSTFVPRRDGPRRLEQAFRLLLGPARPPEGTNPRRREDRPCEPRSTPASRPTGRSATRRLTASSTALRQWADRPRPRTPARARLHRRGLLRRPARPARPSTASATPPARASSTSSAVYSPDRLARKYAYQVLLLEEFRKAGCEVAFVQRPISDDPHDQLLLQIQGAIAEYERAVLGERFRRGKLQKARAGQWVAGKAPYGYRYVPKRDGVPGHLVIDEAEAEVVRMLYRWLIDERMTVRQILKRLAAGPWRPRSGKRLWSNCVVHRILSDPVYTGTAYANRLRRSSCPRKPRSARPAGRARRPAAGRGRARSGSRSRSRPSSTRRPISRRRRSWPGTRPCPSATTPATTTCSAAC